MESKVEIPKIKVYIKIDENKVIKRIESEISSPYIDFSDWIMIDEGYGDKYALAQGNYLEKGIIDEKSRHNYKYDDKLVELTEEEKDTLFPVVAPVPTLEERTKATEDTLLMLIDMQTGGI